MTSPFISPVLPADTFPSSIVTSSPDVAQTFISIQPGISASIQQTSSIQISPFIAPGEVATDIGQMYSVSPQPSSVSWQYNVGEPPVNTPQVYTFRNVTINANLQFVFNYADFLQIDTSGTIVIAPEGFATVTVSLNESAVKDKSVQSNKIFSNMFSWTTTPLDITGPIYLFGAPHLMINQ